MTRAPQIPAAVAKLPPKKQLEWSTGHDLHIPPFLLVANRPRETQMQHVPEASQQTAQVIEPWQERLAKVEPPEMREYLEQCMRRGHFNRHWLVARPPYHLESHVDEILAEFRVSFERAQQRKLENAARLAEFRARAPKKVNPLSGLVPLRKILEGMGDAAPKRGRAQRAIDEAKLEHTRYHFQPGVATLARVEQVIRSYRPPERQAAAPAMLYPPESVIGWSGENPKRPGSAAHARWETVRAYHGKTVGALLAAGGNPVTLHNAVTAGRVTLDGAVQQKAEVKETEAKSKAKPESKSKSKSKPKSKQKRGKVRT